MMIVNKKQQQKLMKCIILMFIKYIYSVFENVLIKKYIIKSKLNILWPFCAKNWMLI